MIRQATLGLFAALCLLTSHAARAEPPDARDMNTITTCLQTFDKGIAPQENYEACVKKIATPCMNDDENGVPPSQQIECYNREQMVWDKILNDSYKVVMAGLEPKQQEKLRAMQRSWIQTRDLTCAFYYEYFQGTMANPMMAACDNRESARRAIYIRIFAQDMAPRK